MCPPFAARASRRCSLTWVQTCWSRGKRYGWSNLARLRATDAATGTTATARRAAATRRPSARRRWASHQPTAATAAAPQTANPPVVRVRTAARAKAPSQPRLRRSGAVVARTSQYRAPTTVATDHTYTSWYTHGSAASKVSTVPAVVAASSTAARALSLPARARSSPTRTRRASQNSFVAMIAKTSQPEGHRHEGQPAVELARHEHHRDAEQGRERREVHVGAPADDEALDAEAALRARRGGPRAAPPPGGRRSSSRSRARRPSASARSRARGGRRG